jgi:hypothetical protein
MISFFSGGFDLQETSSEMVQRVLKMLEQFLISNQTLKLDESFKVYLKILSIEHMKFKNRMNGRVHKKRTKKFYKKHYGARIKAVKNYNYFWALDIPDSFPNEPRKCIFKNKCLILATILGLLQNIYYKSERQDTRFLQLQYLNSVCRKKKNLAGNLLLKEFNELILRTNIPEEGPHELEKTVLILHNVYNCQFYIFDGIDNTNKLKYLYPPVFDDSLIPIYLYEPHDNPNHVVFIRNISSYFRGNLKICFACKKSFLTYNHKHFCKEKQSCFSCRRFFSSPSTYEHEKLRNNYCDKNITKETSFLCSLCNVTCYSKHCYNGHKLLCSGKGTFGYKCLSCNKFTYRYGKLNGEDLKKRHICGGTKNCNCCRKVKEENHLCPLIKDIVSTQNYTNIAFLTSEYFDSSIENCLSCINLAKSNSTTLFCDLHSNINMENSIDSDPCLIVLYLFTGKLKKYIFSNFGIEPVIFEEENIFLPKDYSNFNLNQNPKKLSKRSQDFERNFANLQKKSSIILMDKFLQLILTWQNVTFICQDSDSRTYMTILRTLLKNGFCPVIVRNGRKILVLEIKALNLRFITSNSYFDGNEFEVANQYSLNFNQHFFPTKFLLPQNINYEGKVPQIQFFFSILDTAKETKKKQKFVDTLIHNKYKWNLQKELLTYCEQKVLLLTLSCLQFLEDCLSFQNLLNVQNQTSFNFLNPFAYPLCSLGGYVYKLFKIFYLNKDDIFAINNEFGISCKNVSKIEYEWASFMDYLYPEKEFLYAFNNKLGQKYFKEAIPDLYSNITKQAYFFNGCVYHGHFENCLLNVNATEMSKNPFGKTYKELNDEFFIKMKNLLNNNDEINEIVIRWECHYKKLRESEFIQNFLQSKFKFHPLIRLKPRSCVRGAYFDLFALKWSKQLYPNENMFFLDVNGLYSYCAIQFKYMKGKYNVLIGKEIENISLVNNKFVYKNVPIMGSMLVTILPPSNLLFPFLLYRTKGGKTVNTLCSKCCENLNQNCNHSDLERAITSCYMISEIEFALKLNYKLLFIHECHCYESFDYILKDFVTILNFLKTKYSDCLDHCKTNLEQDKYCNFLNEEMKLTKPFLLDRSEVKFNKSKRTFFKLMANSLFGKLEQKNNKSQTLYVTNQEDLEKIFFSENEINDIFCVNDNICQVQISPNELKLKPNRKNNCYIGAQVTAFARQIIYTHIQTLLQSNATIYRVDCDSIIFTIPESMQIPLSLSHAVGHFKSEIDGEIQSFYSLGPKSYSLSFFKNKEFHTISRVSGLSLGNSLSKDVLTDATFDFYIEQFLKKKRETLKVKQQRIKGNFKKFKVNSVIENVTFSNDLSKRRYICRTNAVNYPTFPYGFNNK